MSCVHGFSNIIFECVWKSHVILHLLLSSRLAASHLCCHSYLRDGKRGGRQTGGGGVGKQGKKHDGEDKGEKKVRMNRGKQAREKNRK